MKILGHHVHVPILVLFVAEFLLSATSFAVVAWLLLPEERPIPFYGATVFASAVVLGLTTMGLYQAKQRVRLSGVVARVFVGLVVAGTGLAVLQFILNLEVGRLLWGTSFGVALVVLVADRIAFWKLVDHEAFRRSTLILGAGQRASTLLKLRRRSDQRGFRIVGFVPAPGDRVSLPDDRVLRLEESLLDYSLRNEIDEIVVAMDERRQGFPFKELLDCKFAGIEIVDLLEFLERETGKVRVDLVNPSWLIFSQGFARSPIHRFLNRALDLVASVALLVIFLPVALCVVVAIYLDDGRPVLYRQKRVGLMGKPFMLYKFRSMVKSAEANGAVWAGQQDARVTRVGKIIRKLRLDEVPQLLNVIRGDMRLVGPRPERPEFVETLAASIPYYHERHSVKPGITGWAQLCYPYGSSDEDAMEKLQFDLYYIKHADVVFDLVVLLQTVEVMLWGKGAR